MIPGHDDSDMNVSVCNVKAYPSIYPGQTHYITFTFYTMDKMAKTG